MFLPRPSPRSGFTEQDASVALVDDATTAALTTAAVSKLASKPVKDHTINTSRSFATFFMLLLYASTCVWMFRLARGYVESANLSHFLSWVLSDVCACCVQDVLCAADFVGVRDGSCSEKSMMHMCKMLFAVGIDA
jgi:hypothetical protein